MSNNYILFYYIDNIINYNLKITVIILIIEHIIKYHYINTF